MKTKKTKKIIKIILILLLIVIGVFLGHFIYNKVQAHKFKKLLSDNDAVNYELIETTNDDETIVKVKDKVLLSENQDTITWVSEPEKKRVILNQKYQTAIITESDDDLEVNSLNHTYIENYLENSNQKFKYLGEKDGFYQLQFTEKKTKNITIIYINKENSMVEKINYNADGYEFMSQFSIKKNSVSNKDIEYPDLTDYHIYDSVSSNVK